MEKKASYKTVLLGDSSVGKSSIVLRLTKDTFHDNTNTTIGASFCTYVVNLNNIEERNIDIVDNDERNRKNIETSEHSLNDALTNDINNDYKKNKNNLNRGKTNNRVNNEEKKERMLKGSDYKTNEKNETTDENLYNIKFDIWDTAGQERYASIVPLYYRGATCAIVVFDVSNLNSFDRAKTWVNQLKISSNYIIILVANKIDKNNFKVDILEAQKYAQENNLLFIQTSAKTGKNIKNIFYMLAQEIYKSIITTKSQVEAHSSSKDVVDLNTEKKKKSSCC